MKKILSVGLALILLLCCAPAASAADADLAFRTDGTFRILHVTDTQDDAFPAPDMLNLLREAVAFSDPDLIVFTGDIVEDSRVGDRASDARPGIEGVRVQKLDGSLDAEKTRANVIAATDAVFSVLEEAQVPYAVALGNNDRKVGLTGADWIELLTQYEHCIFFDESPDETDGVDYHVTLRGSDGGDAFNLWLMDTRSGGVSDAQINWYRETGARLTAENGGKPLPALVFQHIQTPDIGNLFIRCGAAEPGARKSKDGWVRLNPEIAGGYDFYGYEPGITSGEFAAWKECGDVIGAFFGHQHVEGFSGVWNGIELGFTYGCEFAKNGPYGFRVLTLHEEDPTRYDNTLYRYTGSVRLGNVKLVSEAEYSGQQPPNACRAMLAKLRDLLLSFISILTVLFR